MTMESTTFVDGEAVAQADVDAKEAEAESDSELIQQAKECYRVGIDATRQWRLEAVEDMEFLAGDQWDSAVKSTRSAQGRPALTVNRLPQFLRQVTNEQRQSKPSITVNPVDSGSDVRTAEVLQGVIRNIEYTSNADAAYAKAGECAAAVGLGYWDIECDFENEKSFEQRIVIRRITNPLSIVMDPGTKEVAGDDARWAIKSWDMSEAEWKSKFPGKDIPKSTGWDGQGDVAAPWVAEKGVRIHEYRYIKEEPDTLIDISAASQELLALLQLAEVDATSGAVLASEIGEELAKALIGAGADFRDTTRRKACWVRIAGDEILERGEYNGRYLQLVRVMGTELEIQGRTIYEGIIRHAKDSQRMHNYYVSSEAEAIALTPKGPWLAEEHQIEDYEDDWNNANQRPISVLKYKATTNGGHPVPPPQRVMAEANVQAITNARVQSADDLKAVTGIYDAALGARSNEQSGRAILARQSQGQTANFHFQDNLGFAIRLTGRILIDLIPKVYSGPRVLRMLGEDGKPEMVPVNQPAKFRGEPVTIQLDAGRYDVAVSMGPSYHSRRQETAALLGELFKADPSLSRIAGDLYVKSLDVPGGEEIAKRIAKMLPPEIRPPDEKQPPPQVMAQQLQQLSNMYDQVLAQLKQAQEALERNVHDNETKERIEMTKLHTQLVMKLAELDAQQSLALLKAETAAVSKRLNLTGFNEPIEGAQPQGA